MLKPSMFGRLGIFISTGVGMSYFSVVPFKNKSRANAQRSFLRGTRTILEFSFAKECQLHTYRCAGLLASSPPPIVRASYFRIRSIRSS
jgi:hypothetical protein